MVSTGILDLVPSTVASPMPEEEGAWVRADAWTKALRKIDDAYPHGFRRWCSCEASLCHSCRTRHHDQCISAASPRVDEHAGTMTDRGGFVVAVIRYGPDQQPCRWICPCTHETHTTADKAAADVPETHEVPTTHRSTAPCPASAPVSAPDGQLSLFTGVVAPEESTGGDTP
ncbi:DUF6248 family natural product biosynthesis protein [Streptomyces cylindrosporus]|uniref:DUF6248 family natural product biosynthesis protein n=1 Tax=Streptomyces cylindrosporus TaxID=2927583 RepID=A0ABS9Y8H9_9ACTN|nr:DUF6248 family natural product biosynthesis protein [Streptomyces cylindrosporus]MCI3273529.1 DUF6248 family natural product biosynthesis protein [Streptomyces cylindrosporus]